jgi:hypothetical protein
MQSNDMAVMADKIGYAPVPTGAQSSSAITLPIEVFTSANLSAITSSVLTNTSAHMYKFTAGAGTAFVSADVIANWGTFVRANADLLVQLLFPNGTSMAQLNPPGITAPVGLGVGRTAVNLPTAGT